jgi:methyltransferase
MDAFLDPDPGAARLLLAALLLARLAEFTFARRNAERLRDECAAEFGADVQFWLPIVHAMWLAALMLASERAAPWWPALALYAPVFAWRTVEIVRLGRLWTTRLVRLPDGTIPDTRRADIATCIEFAILPFAFGIGWAALVFAPAGALATLLRRRAEKAVLAEVAPVD